MTRVKSPIHMLVFLLILGSLLLSPTLFRSSHAQEDKEAQALKESLVQRVALLEKQIQERVSLTDFIQMMGSHMKSVRKLRSDMNALEIRLLGKDASKKAMKGVCIDHLHAISAALTAWQAKCGKGRSFPQLKGEQFILQLVRDGMITDSRVLMCPATGRSNKDVDMEKNPSAYTDYQALDNRPESFHSLVRLVWQEKIPTSKIPVVWDKKGNHKGRRQVLFLDGHLDSLSEEEFIEKFGDYERED